MTGKTTINRRITIGSATGTIDAVYENDPGDRETKPLAEWTGTITFEIRDLESVNGTFIDDALSEIIEGLEL